MTKVADGDQLVLDLMLVDDNLRPAWQSRQALPFAGRRIPWYPARRSSQ